MKLTSGAILFFLLLQPSSVLPRTQDAQNGIIDGVVMDAQTKLPVAGVNVSVKDSAAMEKHCVSLPCPRPTPMATTDSAGRFSIPNLRPVSYRLEAWADGYVDVNLGSNVTTKLGAPISLNSAEDAKHLVIHISRTATLSGRILDDRGLPATNLSITAFKKRQTEILAWTFIELVR